MRQNFRRSHEPTTGEPHLSHAEKSSPVEEKKSFKINVLLARDLAFIKVILVGITAVEVVREVKTSSLRFVKFDPQL